MPVRLSVGMEGEPCECVTGLVLGLRGSAITLSRELSEMGIHDALSLSREMRLGKKFTFAISCSGSPQEFLMRRWLDGGGCSQGPTSGIKLLNVGDATWTSSSAVVSAVVVRNECGDAVNAENSFITVQNSIMHDVGLNGITTNGGDTLINNNTMHNINIWGVSVTAGVNSVVSNNVLASQRGINVDGGSTGVQVTTNTIGPYTGTAILAQYSSGLNIKSNKVHGAYAGVWLYQVSGSMVMSNTLSNLYGFGIVDEASHAGNTIQNNVLTEMPKGIVTYNSDLAGDIVTPNTFNQVDVMNTNTLW